MLCLKLHGHLNTMFQHFMTFNREFSLLEEKETEVLDDLYRKLEEGVPPISLEDIVTNNGDKDNDAKTEDPLASEGVPPPKESSPEDNKENENSEANQEPTKT